MDSTKYAVREMAMFMSDHAYIEMIQEQHFYAMLLLLSQNSF